MLINNALVLGTFDRLNKVKKKSDKSVEKLTSGKRINVARDDAAGMAIQESFKSQVRCLSQAFRNTQDGISLMQTADASAENVGRQLKRMKEISIEGSNDTLTDTDRQALDKEFQQLKEEIQSVADKSEFNGIKLLKEDKELSIQTKYDPYQFTKVKLHKLDLESTGLKDVSLNDKNNCVEAIEKVDEAIETVVAVRVDYGSSLNSLKSAAANASTAELSTTASLSKIEDADMAKSMMEYVKHNILQKYNDSMVVYANQDTENVAKLIR
ncbi:flagellin [Haloimpatiens sp. FM7330]|uniref:flagellin n=1 Tax=Haloimpatiens sp. FM7330 TaxID=3298610 RepID=UPI003629415A